MERTEDRDGPPRSSSAKVVPDENPCEMTPDSFERLLALKDVVATVASRFVGIHDLDDAVEASLADMGIQCKASRAYLFHIRPDGAVMDNTHEWCAEGVVPQKDNLQALPVEVFPWWMDKLHKGEVIHITDVAQLPPEAGAERAILEEQDIVSLLVLPLYIEGVLAGFVGLDNVRGSGSWRDEDIALIRTMSDIIGNALELRRATEDLQKSEDRFHQFFENEPGYCYMVSPDGMILDVNKAAAETLGYEKKELVGKPLKTVYAPESLPRMKTLFAKWKREGSLESEEMVILTRKGERRTVLLSATSVKDVEGNIVNSISVQRDITERKRAEEEIANLARFPSENPNPVLRIRKDGTVLYANTAGMTLLGRRHIDVGKRVSKEFLPLIKRVAKSGTLFTLDYDADTGRTFSFEMIPVAGTDYLNVYGRDITERKRAEEALQASEERLRGIFEGATDGILAADPATKRFAFTNPRMCEITGHSEEELVAMGVPDLHPEKDLPYVVEQFERQVRGEFTVARDMPVLRKDGSVVYCDINPAPLRIGDRELMLGFFRDVTERRNSEERVQHDLKLKSLLGEILRLPYEEHDIEELMERSLGLIVSIPHLELKDKGCIFLVEDEPEVLVLKAQRGLAEPLQTSCARVPFGRCLCGRAAASGEVMFAAHVDERHETSYKGITPHGHYCVPILTSTKRVLGVINLYVEDGHAFDTEDTMFLLTTANVLAGIIERKQVDERLERAAEEWSSTFDAISDLVSIHDENFKIVRVNRAFATTFGKGPEELVGETCFELVHGTDHPPPKCPHREAIATGTPVTRELFEPHLGIHLEMSASPLIGDDGTVTGIVHITKDITERKRAEEELRQLNTELERRVAERTRDLWEAQAELVRNEKLSAIGQVAGGVGHDLRNPLSAISLSADYLRTIDGANGRVKKHVDLIQQQVRNADAIIADLLDFFNERPLSLETCDVNGVVRDALGNVNAPPDVAVETRLDGSLPPAALDGYKIQRVVLNISSNAIQAMHRGGRLTVTTKNAGDVVEMTFTDTGSGIAEDRLSDIFEPLVTYRKNGIGLGLPIVKRIVEAHGGSVSVESTIGEGTTFTVKLPLRVEGVRT